MNQTHGLDFFFEQWGEMPNSNMPQANDFVCPHCGDFSYFSRGNPEIKAAELWRNAVCGFTPSHHGAFAAGVAVMRCPKCGKAFQLLLHVSTVRAYALGCSRWPKSDFDTTPSI